MRTFRTPAAAACAVAAVWILCLGSAPVMAAEEAAEGFEMKVMDAFSIAGGATVLTGLVKAGVVKTGDTVCVPLTDGRLVPRTVEGIETFRKLKDSAAKGESIGIQISELDPDEIDKDSPLLGSGCT